ncbi:MAG: 4-alpha-glucanotransferase [Brevinema sp.]
MKRESGVLLPIFSLWGGDYSGVLGEEARSFIDFLAEAGQRYWQVLPSGPTGFGDSPYQSYSSWAGNPFFIDIRPLIEKKLLDKNDFPSYNGDKVDYDALRAERIVLLKKAYQKSGYDGKLFAKKHPHVEDYAVFMALKSHFNDAPRSMWSEANYKHLLTKELKKSLKDEINFHLFVQEIFYEQWLALKEYACQKGIQIIGDMPIYAAEDSADLWASPEFFQLEADGKLSAVAGVPPDYFSETGQLWGNPLYNWDALEKDGFKWWIERIEGVFMLFDMVRIDHFRGFESYWSVPYGDKTAQNGTWIEAKGSDLFKKIHKKLGKINAIAEDLGIITPEVKALMKETGFPGMKVLLFAFYAGQESDYMPHKYTDENCLVYTGTHDNDTVVGWFNTGSQEDISAACDYLKLSNPTAEEFAWAYVDAAWKSKARIAIAPLQDIMALGGETRINVPSTLGGNWTWRLTQAPDSSYAKRLHALTKETGRLAN